MSGTIIFKPGLSQCCFLNLYKRILRKDQFEVGTEVVSECCGETVKLDQEKVWKLVIKEPDADV